LSESAFATI